MPYLNIVLFSLYNYFSVNVSCNTRFAIFYDSNSSILQKFSNPQNSKLINKNTQNLKSNKKNIRYKKRISFLVLNSNLFRNRIQKVVTGCLIATLGISVPVNPRSQGTV